MNKLTFMDRLHLGEFDHIITFTVDNDFYQMLINLNKPEEFKVFKIDRRNKKYYETQELDECRILLDKLIEYEIRFWNSDRFNEEIYTNQEKKEIRKWFAKNPFYSFIMDFKKIYAEID